MGELINSKEIERRDKILEDDRILEQMVKVREMELYDDFLNDELGTTEYSEEFFRNVHYSLKKKCSWNLWHIIVY